MYPYSYWQIFCDGFYSADPHPGNILVDRYQNKISKQIQKKNLYAIHAFHIPKKNLKSQLPKKKNQSTSKRAVLLDFGLVKELGLETRYYFAKLLVAAAATRRQAGAVNDLCSRRCLAPCAPRKCLCAFQSGSMPASSRPPQPPSVK